MAQTFVVYYDNRHEMDRGIKQMQKDGWSVVTVDVVPQGYGFLKTCCLGCLFLPLALLGRKPEKFQVMYRREYVSGVFQYSPGQAFQLIPGFRPPIPLFPQDTLIINLFEGQYIINQIWRDGVVIWQA
jgi:hypothetical protein